MTVSDYTHLWTLRPRRSALRRPPFLADLALWLHADNGVVGSGGDLVSWRDLRGNRVGTPAGTLPINPTGLNGRRAIEVDELSEGIVFTGANAGWTNSTSWTLILAANKTNTTFNSIFGQGVGITPRMMLEGAADARGRFALPSGNVNVHASTGSPDIDFRGEAIHVMRAAGTAFDGWKDGVGYSENTDTLSATVDWSDSQIVLMNRGDLGGGN